VGFQTGVNIRAGWESAAYPLDHDATEAGVCNHEGLTFIFQCQVYRAALVPKFFTYIIANDRLDPPPINHKHLACLLWRLVLGLKWLVQILTPMPWTGVLFLQSIDGVVVTTHAGPPEIVVE
jgi:hypothetical protein